MTALRKTVLEEMWERIEATHGDQAPVPAPDMTDLWANARETSSKVYALSQEVADLHVAVEFLAELVGRQQVIIERLEKANG